MLLGVEREKCWLISELVVVVVVIDSPGGASFVGSFGGSTANSGSDTTLLDVERPP